MSKILLVGATGYVGGTILSQLLTSTESSLKVLTVDVLVRHEHQAKKLHSIYGERIRTVFWAGLADVQFIEHVAAQYEIIVNAGSGFITAGAVAFVDGLARRVEADLPAPWLLHLSGCTNLVDPSKQPFEWNDERDGQAIFDYMKSLDFEQPYSQRTTEIMVLETAAERGVQAVSVQAPCIFGEGTGLFNRQALVIPLILRYVVQHGYGFKLNDQANFDWVHVVDLADYYILLIRAILERPDRGVGYIPSGRKGILFPTVGRALMTEINRQAVNVAFDTGILPREDTTHQREVRLVPLQEIADELTAGRCDIAQRGWGGEKAVRGTIGQKLLGWKPKRLQRAWEQDFCDELIALREGRRGVTMESCIGMSAEAP
ncbi:hypothetical protein EKO04_005530 [Ascochyta lentis]|uniref:NAD-dependent epimerase/dehydratase domain-containing protein n=1 Tax=Ascochyta lentis TaxID=205686 RepID=A0A8H7MK55_9PLEO|nr:hypothetical protein EKO04_005530 [Ascochyta lentis]